MFAVLPEVADDPYNNSGIIKTKENRWQLVYKYSSNPVGICGLSNITMTIKETRVPKV